MGESRGKARENDEENKLADKQKKTRVFVERKAKREKRERKKG